MAKAKRSPASVKKEIAAAMRKAEKMGLNIIQGEWGVTCKLRKQTTVLEDQHGYTEEENQSVITETVFVPEDNGVCALGAVLVVKKEIGNGKKLLSEVKYAADLLGITVRQADSIISGFDGATDSPQESDFDFYDEPKKEFKKALAAFEKAMKKNPWRNVGYELAKKFCAK